MAGQSESNEKQGGNHAGPAKPGAGPLGASPNAQRRARYYERWFGKPRLFWQENEAEWPPIHVLAYPPSEALDRDYYTVITSGMSDASMALPEGVEPERARAELLIYALPSDVESDPTRVPWFVSVLHALAHMPWRRQTWLGEGHTIPNDDPPVPFTEGSSLTTALLLPPLFELPEFAEGLTLDGDPINFYWLTFITTAECELKIDHGYEALMERFEGVNFPHVLEAFRPSFV